MQGTVVPPGILMFPFILSRLVDQATLKPVYLSQPPFPQPKGLPYLQHHSSQKKRVVDQDHLESWEPNLLAFDTPSEEQWGIFRVGDKSPLSPPSS